MITYRLETGRAATSRKPRRHVQNAPNLIQRKILAPFVVTTIYKNNNLDTFCIKNNKVDFLYTE
jgi:hypothetical protein